MDLFFGNSQKSSIVDIRPGSNYASWQYDPYQGIIKYLHPLFSILLVRQLHNCIEQ